jgi:superfamily II DNA or RNA helicase
VQLRSWQTQAFELWKGELRGVIAAVTGAGKTTFALHCIRAFLNLHPDGQVIILVPTLALQDQWMVSLETDGGIQDIGDGRGNPGDHQVTVVVINTFRTLAGKAQSERPRMLIVDECHRAGSPANSKALVGKYEATLGLSATPERQYDDGFTEFVAPALGDIIYEYDYDKAFRDGVIVPFELTNVRFAMSAEDQTAYDKLSKRIAILIARGESSEEEHLASLMRKRARISWNSLMRVPLAIKLALKHRQQRIIIFHESVAHAELISNHLQERGVRAVAYHTGLNEVVRRKNLRLFKSGYYSCLVCCRALDEGLNVPDVTVGIVASGTASTRQRIQRLGRILRKLPDKDSALIYTLYATDAEARRLRDEEENLSAVSRARWLELKESGHA